MSKQKPKRTDITKPKGKSKYALKTARRWRLCKQLGIPDTPHPAIESGSNGL